MPRPSDKVVLETPRLYLREFTSDDALLLFELDSDPEVMRFITKGQSTPLGQIQDEILPRVLGYYTRFPPFGVWAAHRQADDAFIGWYHLRPDKLEPDQMELGYRLKREVWGRGLATEGAAELLRAGFGAWHCDKITARTLRLNLASRRVMEKIGLRFETEFLYPAEMLPEWSEEERRAVKYSLRKEQFDAGGRL